MDIEVFVVNAFTLNDGGGNAAGIVLDASCLTDTQMQEIAARMALSETAFVLPASDADFALRFFTPSAEIDFCGHATVGTGFLLQHKGLLKKSTLLQKTRAGNLAVHCADDGQVFADLALPQFGPTYDAAPLAAILGIAESDISDSGLPVQTVATGLSDIMIPLTDEAALARIRPDFDALARYNEQTATVGIHAFTLASQTPGVSASCRNFAPRFGINEESATGSSSGALACYLSRHADRFGGRYLFEQGKALGQTSRLAATVTQEDGRITRITIGGHSALIKSVVMQV